MSKITDTVETTICSTMHCYNRVPIQYVAQNGEWWRMIRDPAPFCDECKKRQKK